ncbi:MAG: ATP-binding protein, partial [Candidatus Omnitrophota bacterium]
TKLDLILLDVMMPKLDGYEVCRRIKSAKETRFIPVVMLTALSEKEDRIKGIETDADDFISKPFDKEELKARVKSLLRIKSLHDKLEESYEKLKQLESLKDSLTHMIIHDLNNPLVGIMGNLQLLQMEIGKALGDAQRNSLEAALLSSEDMKRMIENLLDINKMEESKIKLRREDFKLDEAAREVVEQMRPLALWENKSILLEDSGQLPEISADKELVKRVIANLINNALKHIPQKGAIRVKVVFKSDERVFYLRVEDNGEGIPKEYLEKVFDKFAQVEDKMAKAGRGLGLTFCKLAVEAHGGKIWVESEPGKGSVFTFTLPNYHACEANNVKYG